jgi:CheY-like chemotaxis protein
MPVRALIVDDQPLIRRNLRLRFARLGCEIAEAENASQGLEVFRSFHPHLVTLDIVMPEIAGFTALDLLRRIRKEDGTTDVVVVTSRVDDRAQFLREGAIEFISKPFEGFDRLITKLQPLIDALNQKPTRSEQEPAG